jgi:general secretion pathway protein G
MRLPAVLVSEEAGARPGGGRSLIGCGSRDRRAERGITYLELLAAVTVLAILATAIVPLARWDDKRRKEAELRFHLENLRQAIDLYKRYADEGLLTQTDVAQLGYPRNLDELVEGVDVGDPDSGERRSVRFLRRIPLDPFTGEATWGLRSYQDDWDSDSWGGENVYDVYSLAPGRALDGTYYNTW